MWAIPSFHTVNSRHTYPLPRYKYIVFHANPIRFLSHSLNFLSPLLVLRLGFLLSSLSGILWLPSSRFFHRWNFSHYWFEYLFFLLKLLIIVLEFDLILTTLLLELCFCVLILVNCAFFVFCWFIWIVFLSVEVRWFALIFAEVRWILLLFDEVGWIVLLFVQIRELCVDFSALYVDLLFTFSIFMIIEMLF